MVRGRGVSCHRNRVIELGNYSVAAIRAGRGRKEPNLKPIMRGDFTDRCYNPHRGRGKEDVAPV